MQIHELNNYNGALNESAYIAVDNGTDTGKISVPGLLADTNQEINDLDESLNARIDNIIAGGDAPSEAEIIDARLGAAALGSVAYPSLGDAIRGQATALNDSIAAVYPVNLSPGTMTNAKAVGRSGALIDANNSAASDYIEVIPGNRIYLGNILAAGSRAICGYNEDKSFVACLYTAFDETSVEFIVQNNIKYLRVTSPINTKPIVRYVDVIDDIKNLTKVEKWNLMDNVAAMEGYVINTDGTYISAVDYYTARFIPVKPNTTYITYSGSDATIFVARRIKLLDEDGAQIGSILNLPGIFTTPATARFIDVSFHYKTSLTYEKYGDYIAEKDAEHFNFIRLGGNKISKDDVIGLATYEYDDTNYMPYRRPLIAFIFDGEYNMNDEFKALFDSHNKKCGYAIQYDTPFDHVSMASYLDWQSNGFEILAHSSVAVGTQGSATDEEIKQIVKDSFNTLYNYGFDVHGFVALQGNAKPIAIQTAQQIFDYAATERNHSGSYGYIDPALTESNLYFDTDAPYYLWRYSMQTSTLQQMKDGVDRCLSTNGLVLFYGHANSSDLNNMTIENIDALLTYIESKDVPITTPYKAIKNYYSLRYQDIVR